MDEGTLVAGAGRYAAFLSYSHKDAAQARWLHRRLETYRIPRRLVGTEGEHGPVPARLTPIFRDREELPAAGDLSERIRAALAASDHLVVLCSPSSAASPWVAKEIEAFRELRPGRPIYAAIVEGEPGECFSAYFLEGGSEPLAADLRRARDGKRLGVLKLVAGLSGVPLDSLVQRDAARRVRRVMAVTAAALVTALLMAVMTTLALQSRREAQRQRAGAESLVEFMLTDLRDRLKAVGRLPIMTSVNERALQYYQRQSLAGLSIESLERRARILHAMGEDDETRDDLARALTEFQEAERTTSALLDKAPEDPERIFDQAQSEYWLGHIAELRGNFAEALASYSRYRNYAFELRRLRPDTRSLGEMAFAESNLGILHLRGLKQPEVARTYFLRSLLLFQRLTRLAAADPKWLQEAADAHAWIADTWFEEKNYPAARRARLEEQRLKNVLLAKDPEDMSLVYGLVITHRSLARIDIALGELDRAAVTWNQARSGLEDLLHVDPSNVVWRNQAARLFGDQAELLLKKGDLGQSRKALRRARALLKSGRPGQAPTATEQKIQARLDTLDQQLRS